MKKMKACLAAVLILCILCACGRTQAEQTDAAVTETQAAETIQAIPETEPPETAAPTEIPVLEQARERIRNGEYQEAADLLKEEQGEEAELLRLRAGMGDVAVGDQLALGRFEQDDESENGTEEIVWTVLEVQEDQALLLSLRCLDTQPYHDVLHGQTTWAESTLRTWLNGEFCDAAFSETEQKLLTETELENKDNPTYRTPGGENTQDRVFLLSLDEVRTYLPGELMRANVTDYASNRGCFRNASKNGWWWLRSPGVYSRDACYVDADGKIFEYGYIIHRQGWAVRPAMWIDLSV